MSETLELVQALVARGEVQPSMHALQEFLIRDIFFDEILAGLGQAVVVEEYPGAHKGRSVLVLQKNAGGEPLHVLWGIPKQTGTPAVVVTAYRPDPALWSIDFLKRSRS